jgi:hypothetical protein
METPLARAWSRRGCGARSRARLEGKLLAAEGEFAEELGDFLEILACAVGEA